MSDKRRAPSFDWSLWLLWILTSALGWFLGGSLLGPLTAGVGMAALQWLLLRPRIHGAVWWIGVSAAGWVLGWGAAYLLPLQLGIFALGAVSGAVQWLLLRRWVHQAGWWIVTSTLGWALGPIFGTPLAGAVVGAVTGLAIVLQLQTPLPEARKQPVTERLYGDESARND